jgi:predicted Zn-dependent peptidase
MKVREERGLAYSVSSGLSPGRYGVSFLVDLQTRNQAVDEALGLVKDELARLGREPVGASELDLAKSYLIGSFPFRLDTSGRMAAFLVAVETTRWPDYPETFGVGSRRSPPPTFSASRRGTWIRPRSSVIGGQRP